MVTRVRASVGTDIPTAATWQALWEESGLRDRMVSLRRIDPFVEVKDRVQWVGWRWALRAWGRLLRLYIMNPAVRQSIKEMFDTLADTIQQMGYGLLAGRK